MILHAVGPGDLEFRHMYVMVFFHITLNIMTFRMVAMIQGTCAHFLALDTTVHCITKGRTYLYCSQWKSLLPSCGISKGLYLDPNFTTNHPIDKPTMDIMVIAIWLGPVLEIQEIVDEAQQQCCETSAGLLLVLQRWVKD